LQINITKSPQGYTLKKPIILEVQDPEDEKQQKIYEYILQTFTGKGPQLAKYVFENKSAFHIAEHLMLHRTGSKDTLFNYICDIHEFTEWMGISPDQILNLCLDNNGIPKPIAALQATKSIEDFAGFLKAKRKLAPATVVNEIKYVQFFFRLNGLLLKMPYSMKKWSLYEDRAPTQFELQKMLILADLREKVILCALATGGFRVGTLASLQYRHVKLDLERQIIPIHVHVEGSITKTKYHDYDTFLNFETSQYLQSYIETRRKGTYDIGRRFFAPEEISEDSPLISGFGKKPLTVNHISAIMRNLLFKAKIIERNFEAPNRRYAVRPHSLRKFFRSQLALLGVDRDVVEYMMGHKTDKYHDVKMNGIEFLRAIYAKSGFSIKPPTTAEKIMALKAIARSWGLTPEEIGKSSDSTSFRHQNL
jgi:site-specific recombinase XerD